MEVSSVPVPSNANPTPQAPAPVDAEPWRKVGHKVKYGGQEVEVGYDELVRDYQNSKESTRRYQEASRLHSEAQTVNKALEQGDIKFLVGKLGAEKAKDLFENYLIEQMEYESLPQERKDLMSERQRREEAERRAKSYEDKENESKRDAQSRAEMERLDHEIADALEAAGKAKTPRLALRIIEQMEAKLRNGQERMSAKEALGYAQKGIQDDLTGYLEDMSAEEAFKALPKAFIDRLLKANLDKVVGNRSNFRSKPAEASQPAVQYSKPMTIEDKYKEMDTKFKRR